MNTFKVGDKVTAKKPKHKYSSNGCCWQPEMDKYEGVVMTVSDVREYTVGVRNNYWSFDFEWLSKHTQFKGNKQ